MNQQEDMIALYLVSSGYSYRAVARLMGVDDKTVKSAVERAEAGNYRPPQERLESLILDLPKLPTKEEKQAMKIFEEFYLWLSQGKRQGFLQILVAFLTNRG